MEILKKEDKLNFLAARELISPPQGDCLPQARGFRTGKSAFGDKYYRQT